MGRVCGNQTPVWVVIGADRMQGASAIWKERHHGDGGIREVPSDEEGAYRLAGCRVGAEPVDGVVQRIG